jgi:hypothetical protein
VTTLGEGATIITCIKVGLGHAVPFALLQSVFGQFIAVFWELALRILHKSANLKLGY